MTRVVIGTNILVSALLQAESLPAAVLALAFSGRVQLCVSEDIFGEYDEVIRRQRFKLPPEVVEGALQSIRSWGIGLRRQFASKNAAIPTIIFSLNAPKRLKLIIWSPAIDAIFLEDGRRPQ